MVVIFVRQVAEPKQHLHDCALLTHFLDIFSHSIFSEFLNGVILAALKRTLRNETSHTEDILVLNAHVKRLDPLLVSLKDKPMIIMDLAQLFIANP